MPAPQRARLSRPELVATLRSGSQARLILISAPAAAGKTTLLASWHADATATVRLVVSRRSRNDPVRFWGYVLASLRTVHPELGPAVDGALRAAGSDVTELALPLLVNALAEVADPLVLVLDDYHEIENADVHQSMEFLIDHLPGAVQVAIASRSDPPLGLARVRAWAERLEVGVKDLRLGVEEATALLNGSLGLGLEPDQVTRLREGTEGWAAGLQLVGLWLQGMADPSGYIASFAGDDRQILDYLAAEVLDHQTPELRAFLLGSSILEGSRVHCATRSCSGTGPPGC
ncbi:MAG: AAA family ATPase [Solirubrobacteraceae bacterium]